MLVQFSQTYYLKDANDICDKNGCSKTIYSFLMHVNPKHKLLLDPVFMQKVTATYVENMCDNAPNTHVGNTNMNPSFICKLQACILPIIPHTKSNSFVFCKRQSDYTTVLGIKMLA
jgi:hypothetical protein